VVILGLVAPWFPAGRQELMAGLLRPAAAGCLPTACGLGRRAS
jgi:hypothetical protein